MAALVALAVGRLAGAAEPVAVQVTANGDCPSAASVELLLRRLLPDATFDANAALRGPIVDRGAAFDVDVAGNGRRFADATRQCAERARQAAVFAAFSLPRA